jgi:hypothetical protein
MGPIFQWIREHLILASVIPIIMWVGFDRHVTTVGLETEKGQRAIAEREIALLHSELQETQNGLSACRGEKIVLEIKIGRLETFRLMVLGSPPDEIRKLRYQIPVY